MAKELDDVMLLCEKLADKVKMTFDQEYLKNLRDLAAYEGNYVFEGQAKVILSEEFGFIHGVFNVLKAMNMKVYFVL